MTTFKTLKAYRASIRIAADGYYVATINSGMDDRGSYARLFAAAPAMLAALKLIDAKTEAGLGLDKDTLTAIADAIALVEDHNTPDRSSVIENVRRYDAALDKAELAPNGDDYNAVLEMLNGAEYRAPHVNER